MFERFLWLYYISNWPLWFDCQSRSDQSKTLSASNKTKASQGFNVLCEKLLVELVRAILRRIWWWNVHFAISIIESRRWLKEDRIKKCHFKSFSNIDDNNYISYFYFWTNIPIIYELLSLFVIHITYSTVQEITFLNHLIHRFRHYLILNDWSWNDLNHCNLLLARREI